MSGVLDAVGGALLVGGATFTMLAGIGVVRFRDTYARMHAASKGPTLGLLLIAAGAALVLRSPTAIVALVLVFALQALTAPVGSHLIGRAIHRRLPVPVDGIDELATADHARRPPSEPRRAGDD